jgi:pimeloyl-ACP methyl ester carboxylesterase
MTLPAVVVATAGGLLVALAALPAAAAETHCSRAELLVALRSGASADYGVAAELCSGGKEMRDGVSVQVLLHGATYSHEYWDFGGHEKRDSYVQATVSEGGVTLAYDAIGTGGSSHPPSRLITVNAAAYVAHQLVSMLRNGKVNGIRFGNVILVGHDLGSLVALQEAIDYADVDGVVVTGITHSLSAHFNVAIASAFQPAVDDSRFMNSGLDRGYVTAIPGIRGVLLTSAFADEDELQKDVISQAELASALPLLSSRRTRAVWVPVLTILGGKDRVACGPDERRGEFDCSSAAAIASQEADFYSPRARLHVCLIPNAGHNLNVDGSYRLVVADITAWSATYVDRQVLRRRDGAFGRVLAADARNDGLPINCSAVTDRRQAGQLATASTR